MIVKCKRCKKADIVKCGFVRNCQRFYCKICHFNFILRDARPQKSGNRKYNSRTIALVLRKLEIKKRRINLYKIVSSDDLRKQEITYKNIIKNLKKKGVKKIPSVSYLSKLFYNKFYISL